MEELEGLKEEIERLRIVLNRSIETNEDMVDIYNKSVELDKLIEMYITLSNGKIV